MILSKNANNKKCDPKLVFFNGKNKKASPDFCHRKLTLKVKFWHFWQLSVNPNSKFNHFLWVCSFLGKNLSNFFYPPVKSPTTRIAILYIPYCPSRRHLAGPWLKVCWAGNDCWLSPKRLNAKVQRYGEMAFEGHWLDLMGASAQPA